MRSTLRPYCVLLATMFSFVFTSINIQAQNTLDNAGLSGTTPAAGAYSMRKLSTGYTGFAIKVRRGGDNAEANVAFDVSGAVSAYSIVTLTAGGTSGLTVGSTMSYGNFYASNSCYLTTWYDQSGNNRHITQTNILKQPMVVSGGVLHTFNGKPAVHFDGASGVMNVPFGAPVINAAGTFSTVFSQPVLQTNFPAIVAWGSAYGPAFGPLDATGKFGLYTSFGPYNITLGPVTANTDYIVSAGWTGTSVTQSRNGVLITGTMGAAFNTILSTGLIGKDNNSASAPFFNGTLPELIIFPSNLSLSSSRQILENNQAAYYLPATINSFTPSAAFTGNTITITGTNFTGATGVTIGGTAAASFTVVSDAVITAVVANGSSGPISVTKPNGTVTSSASFTYKTVIGPSGINNGILMWLDASDIDGDGNAGNDPTNNTSLTTWKDRSGLDNDATTIPGQNPIIYMTSQVNGKPVARFARSSDALGSVLQAANVDIRAIVNPTVTMFTVYKTGAQVNTAGAGQALWGNDNGSWDRFFYNSWNFTNNGIVSLGTVSPTYATVPGSGTTGTLRLMTAVYDNLAPNGSAIYFDGAVVTRFTDNTHPSAAQTSLRIGNDGDGGSFNGDITEFIVYNRKLTDCEIQQVNQYLGAKYGVTFTSATITAGGATTFCEGGSVSLTASSGDSYQWYKNGVAIPGATAAAFNANSTGNYTVAVTTGGCTATSLITSVTVNQTPTVAVSATGPTTFCVGGSTTLSANTGAGQGLRFNGTNTYVNIPSGVVLPATFTQEAWIYSGSGNDGLFHGFLGNQPDGTSFNRAPSMWIYNGKQIHGGFGTGSGFYYYITNEVILQNTWNHIAQTYDGNTLKCYVNGQLVANQTYVAPPANSVPATTGVNNIGRVDNYFNGMMDEVRLWNVTRTQAEIQANMNKTLSPATTGLVGYYKMDEGTGSVTADATAGGRTGTLTNNPAWAISSAPVGATVTWSPSAGLNTTTGAIVIANPSSTTTYTATATDASTGCVATAAQVVTVNPSPVAAISGSNSICTGQSTTLTASGGGTYLWNTGATTASITISPSVTTTYTVTVTNTEGCQSTASRTVTVNALPTVSVAGINSICAGQVTTITASGGGSYLWNTGETSAAITVSPSVTTTYTVTATNAAGCVATASRTVTVNAIPVATISAGGPTDFCSGSNVVLTASAGSSYLWSNSAITKSITVTNSGSYTVTVSNGICSATSAPMVVNVLAKPIAYAVTGGGSYCSGSAGSLVGLGGSQANVNYQLLVNGSATGSPVAGTGSAISFGNQISAGIYTVLATNTMSGCTTTMTGSVTVIISPLPTVNKIEDQTLCATTNTATINFTGSIPGTIYNWTNSNSSIGLPASGKGDIAAFTAVNTTDAPVTANFTVTPSTSASGYAYIASLGLGNVSVINLSTNTKTATIPVGNSPYGVAISPDGSNVYVANRGSSNVSVISTASNTVTATITAGSTPSGVAVTADGSKLYVSNESAGTVTVYNTATNTLLNTISVGSGPRFLLFNADGSKLYSFNVAGNSVTVVSVATNTVLATIPAGSYTNGGALNVDGSRLVAVNYISNTLSVINTSTNTVVSTISAPSNSGLWHAKFSPDGTKLYVTARTLGRVYVYDAVTYALLTTITGITGPTGIDFIADGNKAYITSTSTNTYQINTASNSIEGTINIGSISYSIGNFIQQGSVAVCTGESTTFSIIVNPKPAATITADGPVTFCSGGSVTLTASAGSSYLWNTGETSQSIVVSESGSYSVTVTNESGCENTSAPAVVTVQPLPTVTIAAVGGTSVCPGNTVALNTTTISGTGSITTYQWYKDGSVINGANGSSYVAPSTGVYTVTVFNTANCSASSNAVAVTVVDDTPPVFIGQPQLTAPTITQPDGTVNAASPMGAAVYFSLPGAIDNCSGNNVSVVAQPASGSLFPIGTTTVTYVATDANGLSVSGTFDITVNGLPPVIVCPEDIHATTTAGQCGAIVDFAAAETTAVPTSIITYSENGQPVLSGSFFAVGTHVITATATNSLGTSSCNFTITVTDNEAPTVITKNVIILLNASGSSFITPSQINNGSTDNCGIRSVSLNKTGFNCSNLGDNTVMLTVTDIHGNSMTAAATVTVRDNLAPVPVVGNLPVITAQCGVTLTGPKAVDNCAGPVTATTTNPMSYTVQGNYTITWTYQDGSGNTASQQQTVIVKDNTAPVALTKNITVPLDATGHVTVTPAQVDNGSSDNCTPVTLAFATGITSGTICASANEGGTLVLTAPAGAVITGINFASYGTPNGSCGNFSLGSCNAVGSKSIVEGYALGQNSVAIPVNNGVFGDPCYGTYKRLYVQATYLLVGGNATVNSSASFDCSNIGTNNVALLVTDANGNQSVKQATITVKDLTPAMVVVRDIIVPLNAAGTASITAADIDDSSTDACGILSMTVSQDNFTCANIGANNVTLTVTDVNGNISTGVAIVTIVDQIAPTVNTNNINVQLSANGTVTITPAQINNSSTDNCRIASMSLDKTSFDCSQVGANTVILTVTDVNGNSATQTAIVTVVDQIAPIVRINNVVIALDANGAASVTPAQINNGSTDNCGIASVSLDKTSFDCSQVGANTVFLTVTDVNGNSASQSATVTVTDQLAPVMTVPASQVFCANASSQYTIPAVAASDNCNIATVTYSVSGAGSRTGNGYDASGAFNIGTSTITWTVTDVNGNSSTGSTTIVVNPLPVATYVSSNADAFCNQTSVTASSNISPALYRWSASNIPGDFTGNPVLSLGLTNADGNYYLYVQSSATGCVSAMPAVYNYQKQNLASSYTILAYKEVELGKYNKVLSGSVGIMAAKGEAEFKRYSGVTGVGSFVKAPKIDKDGSGITLNSQITGIAAITLPTMQYNTVSTQNLPSVTASQNNATLTGNYKNLTVRKGVSVTVYGSIFGNIRLEEGASIRFNSTVLNIENFTADRGAKNNDYSYIRFAPNTSVRVGNKVNIGSQVLVNPDSYKVSFYMGDEHKDEEKFTVKGSDTRVIANILMPNGKLRVVATDADNDDHEDCDHKAHSSKDCRHRGHEHNDCDHRGHNSANCQDDVYMTGLFIAEEVESKGNKVIWNSFDCNAPAAPVVSENKAGITQSVSLEKLETTTEAELKVTVMPNPSTTYFTLKLESRYEIPVNLRVMDGSGRVVDARSKLAPNSTFQIGHTYSSGTYYAELIQGTRRKVVQLIKAKG